MYHLKLFSDGRWYNREIRYEYNLRDAKSLKNGYLTCQGKATHIPYLENILDLFNNIDKIPLRANILVIRKKHTENPNRIGSKIYVLKTTECCFIPLLGTYTANFTF